MPLESLPPNETIPMHKAGRHFIVFQIKLFVDAFRDLLFSPISLVAFLLDALLRPPVRESFSYRLMLTGRRSDRVINLFDEYTNSGDYTIDETVAEVETAVQREIKRRKEQEAREAQNKLGN
ncbi:MAG: hypothetical protein AAF431_05065 [Pseudomonadota bacterium]